MTGHQKHKTVRHFHRPGDCHELTFSCVRHRPLLEDDVVREKLAISIDNALTTHALRLSAFVFMPEHVHLLVWPESPADAPISEFLKTLKLSCSTRVKRYWTLLSNPLVEELSVLERPGKRSFRFWQEGPGYDRNLDQPRSVLASIDYIHLNPVRRKLCATAVDWDWSSARYYVAGAQSPPTLPTWTPLPAQFLQGG